MSAVWPGGTGLFTVTVPDTVTTPPTGMSPTHDAPVLVITVAPGPDGQGLPPAVHDAVPSPFGTAAPKRPAASLVIVMPV